MPPGQAQGRWLWRGASQSRGWAGTSRQRWQAWLAAAPPCAGDPWAPLAAAPAEHNRGGTRQPPAPSASRRGTGRQGWPSRPPPPRSRPRERPPSTPGAGVSAGRASQQQLSPLGAAWCPCVLASAPSPLQRCRHGVPVPGGLAPFPKPAGCPLTLIFSASSSLGQKTSRPCDKPLCLVALHSVRMLWRKRIFWASSWQPGDRETKGERERGRDMASTTRALGVQCLVEDLGGSRSAQPAALQQPGSRQQSWGGRQETQAQLPGK